RFDNQTVIQSPGGTLPLIVKRSANESAEPDLAVFRTNNGDSGSLAASTGIFVIGAATGKALGLDVNHTTRALTIGSDGNVGIGTNIIGAKLDVAGNCANSADTAFRVRWGLALRFAVYCNGTVSVGWLAPPTTTHACLAFVGSPYQHVFADC